MCVLKYITVVYMCSLWACVCARLMFGGHSRMLGALVYHCLPHLFRKALHQSRSNRHWSSGVFVCSAGSACAHMAQITPCFFSMVARIWTQVPTLAQQMLLPNQSSLWEPSKFIFVLFFVFCLKIEKEHAIGWLGQGSWSCGGERMWP